MQEYREVGNEERGFLLCDDVMVACPNVPKRLEEYSRTGKFGYFSKTDREDNAKTIITVTGLKRISMFLRC